MAEICEVTVKRDVFDWLANGSTSAGILDMLGNRDLDEAINLYQTIAASASRKARAYQDIRDGLEQLERLEAESVLRRGSA